MMDAFQRLQRAIICAILVEGIPLDEIRDCVSAENLRADYFTDPDARALFRFFLENPGIDGKSLRVNSLNVVECRVIEDFLEERVSPEYVKVYIRKFAEKSRENVFTPFVASLSNALTNGKLSPDEFKRQTDEAYERYSAAQPEPSDLDGKSPSKLGPQIPEEENPDALFKNGWLRKGGAAVLVAQTGVGKSVIAFQMAYAWARGLAAFGIEPIKPLKIAIVQSEDDEDEQRKFRDSMMRGYREFHHWTDDDLKEADANIKLYYVYDKKGAAFIDWLRRVQRKHKFDLLIINPLQGFVDLDLNDNNFLRDFLCGGKNSLDLVIKDEKTKCGLFIVHHTNKPGERNPAANTAYLGAGGATLANWMRAALTLTKDGGKPDTFNLAAPKRGKKLPWPNGQGPKLAQMPNVPDEPEYLFWKVVGGIPETTGGTVDPKQQAEDDIAKVVAELKTREEGWSKTDASKAAQKLLSAARGIAAYKAICANPRKFGFSIIDTGNNNKQLLVPLKTGLSSKNDVK